MSIGRIQTFKGEFLFSLAGLKVQPNRARLERVISKTMSRTKRLTTIAATYYGGQKNIPNDLKAIIKDHKKIGLNATRFRAQLNQVSAKIEAYHNFLNGFKTKLHVAQAAIEVARNVGDISDLTKLNIQDGSADDLVLEAFASRELDGDEYLAFLESLHDSDLISLTDLSPEILNLVLLILESNSPEFFFDIKEVLLDLFDPASVLAILLEVGKRDEATLNYILKNYFDRLDDLLDRLFPYDLRDSSEMIQDLMAEETEYVQTQVRQGPRESDYAFSARIILRRADYMKRTLDDQERAELHVALALSGQSQSGIPLLADQRVMDAIEQKSALSLEGDTRSEWWQVNALRVFRMIAELR